MASVPGVRRIVKQPQNILYKKIYTTDENSEEKPISFFSFIECETIKFNGEIKEISINDFLNLYMEQFKISFVTFFISPINN